MTTASTEEQPKVIRGSAIEIETAKLLREQTKILSSINSKLTFFVVITVIGLIISFIS